MAPPAELKSHHSLLQTAADWLLITAQSPSLHENISEAWSGNREKALVSHSTSEYVAYYWTDSQGLGRFPWWFNYTKLVTELLCACSEMSAGWDPWKILNWFIQNTIEKNFSYTKWSLIEEDIRHKLEIALENFFFCWTLKKVLFNVPEQKMVIKVETDKQDMSKGQQKRPSLTGALKFLFHCTQIWRRTSSPVLTVEGVSGCHT